VYLSVEHAFKGMRLPKKALIAGLRRQED